MVTQEIHGTDAPETMSEAAMNYAGAAVVFGAAVLVLGFGIGRIRASVREYTSGDFKGESVIDQINAALRRTTANAPKQSQGQSHGTVKHYYVKKAFKKPVVAGMFIPSHFVVEKGDMSDAHFSIMANVRFKSTYGVIAEGDLEMIHVDEIVNSAQAKPV